MFTRVILLAALPLLVFYLYRRTRYFRLRQFAAYPQLPPSLVWGHMKAFNEFITRGESRRHIDKVFSEVAEHLDHPPLFILDLRPVEYPLCVICRHDVAEQISRTSKEFPYSTNKSPTMHALDPLIGPKSIISSEGEEWKSLRKRFNPGFSPQHLMSLLPCILDRSWHFLNILDKYATAGEEFGLDELCINLTFDIIGAVTMDEDFRAQSGQENQSEIVRVFREINISYRSGGEFGWSPASVIGEFRRGKMSRRLDTLLKSHIKKKFEEQKAHSAEPPGASKKSRSILALSLQGVSELDSQLLDQTCDQLKSFLFAGHDTTSIVLQWAFYELSRTPHALKAIRGELDTIFGPDTSPATVREKLLSPKGDELVRKMTYTSAVIKETLRLYPPSGTARLLRPGTGFNVQLPDGQSLCLDGTVIYNCETIIQRDKNVYGATKDVFVPERWLGNTDTSMETNTDEKGEGSGIPRSAWRPFERGPRNCIGQELANIEARVILACTVRRYNFIKVGLGAIARNEKGMPRLGPNGQYDVESELFNIRQVTAKPVDGTLVRVTFTPGSSPRLHA